MYSDTKRCTKCRKRLNSSLFHKNRRTLDGLQTACKNCQKIRKGEWRRCRENLSNLLIEGAKTRATRCGIPFSLSGSRDRIQQAIDRGACEMTGIPFDFSRGRQRFASPSLDRIDPAEGYTDGNIRVVCWAINRAMGNFGEAALWNLFTAWAKAKRRSKNRNCST